MARSKYESADFTPQDTSALREVLEIRRYERTLFPEIDARVGRSGQQLPKNALNQTPLLS